MEIETRGNARRHPGVVAPPLLSPSAQLGVEQHATMQADWPAGRLRQEYRELVVKRNCKSRGNWTTGTTLLLLPVTLAHLHSPCLPPTARHARSSGSLALVYD